MPVCSSCGRNNQEGFKFCGYCGASLVASAPEGVERKVVSILFVDLVGFTARSETADPEDVEALLRTYHNRVKKEIQRYGGTVEKFVGDAVMAVFGAPVAHEDDAERAVLSALRVLEAIGELNEDEPDLDLSVRAGVNTGEAAVSLGRRPEHGESLVSGDVVNTSARLQAAARANGILVGEATYRTTKAVIAYEPMGPLSFKGKANPIPVWRVVSARARFGVEVARRHDVPLVGRIGELDLLERIYSRCVRDPSVQLVTITGEPGIGKSRLVSELGHSLDDRPELVRWRQGRCLPYGEGITFWALGEIVKAQAGILESDDPALATAKLHESVAAVVRDERQRDWVQTRLASLVGAPEGDGTTDRSESFAAWRTFLEALAASSPLALVFEDLHWADDALLDFIEHFIDWSPEVPILIVCTARPELFERRRGWAGGKRNSTTISLSPLTVEETARLTGLLLSEVVLPAETQQVLMERAEGNPLYAEEFVRMLTDRGILRRTGKTYEIQPDAQIPVPETIHSIIAARLDTLSPERKSLLQAAAVMGKVFWSGSTAAMTDTQNDRVMDALQDLVRKELIRRARDSSVAGEVEYSFWHILVRDVAYHQLARARRSQLHRRAARWIEAMAGERVEDHAEQLANHYQLALDLGDAAGMSRDPEVVDRALAALAMAGDRARRFDVGRAADYFRRAVELVPPGHPDRRNVLTKLGDAIRQVGDLSEAVACLEEAAAEAHNGGDSLTEGRALARLSKLLWHKGETDRSSAMLDRAITLLEQHPPGPDLAYALTSQAAALMTGGRSSDCLVAAERALAMAKSLDIPEELMSNLQYRGITRFELGDIDGVEDLREALRIGLERHLGDETATVYVNLGNVLWLTDGPQRSLEVNRTAVEFSERMGLRWHAMWARIGTVQAFFDLGRWDELMGVIDTVLQSESESGESQVSALVLPQRTRVLAYRGRARDAAGDAETVAQRARDIGEPQVLAPALGALALVKGVLGDLPGALATVEELEATSRGQAMWLRAMVLPEAVEVALQGDRLDLCEQLVEGVDARAPRERHSLALARGMIAQAAGDPGMGADLLEMAAIGWREYGFVLGQAKSLMHLGKCRMLMNQSQAATESFNRARDLFSTLGAAPFIKETDSLIEGSVRLSS